MSPESPLVVEPRRRSAKVHSAPIQPVLSINDLKFVNAYQALGFTSPGHIDAYQSVHPKSKRESARVSAERVLQKPTVKAEIARRIEATQVVTVSALTACLLKYRQWAEQKEDYQAASDIAMHQAKLAGLLVSKVEDVTERVADRQQVLDALRTRGLLPVTSS